MGVQIPKKPARFARRNVDFPKDFQSFWTELYQNARNMPGGCAPGRRQPPGRRQRPENENLFFGTSFFVLLSAARSRQDSLTHPEPPSPVPAPGASQTRLRYKLIVLGAPMYVRISRLVCYF